MLKIIFGYITSWINFQPNRHTLNIAYTNCLYATERARTISQLLHAKQLIKMHQELTNRYNTPILLERQQELTALWNRKYQQWKNKGY